MCLEDTQKGKILKMLRWMIKLRIFVPNYGNRLTWQKAFVEQKESSLILFFCVSLFFVNTLAHILLGII